MMSKYWAQILGQNILSEISDISLLFLSMLPHTMTITPWYWGQLLKMGLEKELLVYLQQDLLKDVSNTRF